MNEPVFAGADAAPIHPPPRRRSPWLARILILMAIGAVLVAAFAMAADALSFASPVHVSVDGQEVFSGFDIGQLEPAHKLLLAVLVMVGLLAALVIVPLAMMLALIAVLGAVLLVVGLPLMAAVAGIALLLSPLLLFGWLSWKLIAS